MKNKIKIAILEYLDNKFEDTDLFTFKKFKE